MHNPFPAIGRFFSKVDHAFMVAMKFIASFINGTEIKQAIDLVVKAGEQYVVNEAEGITDKVVNVQRREWVVGELVNLGFNENKARMMTETAVAAVKNGVHHVIAELENVVNAHIAKDETDAGLPSDQAGSQQSAQGS